MTDHDEDCCCVHCRDTRWAEDRAEDGIETGQLVRTTTGMTDARYMAGPLAAAVQRLLSKATNLDLETVRFEVLRVDQGQTDVAVVGHLRGVADGE